MSYYNSIFFITFSLLILMLSIIICNQNMSRRKRNAFICIYIIILIASSCEWLGYSLNGISGYVIHLHKSVKFVELFITPIFPVVYAQAIFAVDNEPKSKKLNMMPWTLLTFHTILEFLSIHYGFIFYIDINGYYHHANFYQIYIFAFVISAFYFFKELFTFSKYYQNQNIINLSLIIIFIIAGTSMQFIDSDIKTTWLTVSIASIFVYIYYIDIAMHVDHLTKLLNQRSYKNNLEKISFSVVIILFDVDNFKGINDNFGHTFGDVVLNSIGKVIKDVYRNYGNCYRIGGDEFCVILTKYDYIKELNQTFVNQLEKLRESEPNLPYVSMGYVYFDPDNQDISDAIYEADQKLYYWKTKLKSKREAEIL